MIRLWKQLSHDQRIHIQIWLFFAVILIVMLTVTWYGRLQTVPHGISLSGWHVGNIPLTEFYDELHSGIRYLEQQQIVIDTAVPNSSPPLRVTAGELGLYTNADKILAKLQPLTEGNLLLRATHRWFMRGTSFNLEIGLDEEYIERIVHRHWEALQASEPINAKRTITSFDQVQLEQDVPAFRINTTQLLDELHQIMYTQFYAWKDKKLLDSSDSIKMDLPLKILPADVTVEQLEAEHVERKISEFSTRISASSTAGRRHNITATAQILHDTLLAPGDVFDYSKIIERTRQEIGYKPAPVIMNGKFVPGVGGGICQISTTLYNAVIRTGLEIVERRNHSLPISYVPLGQDATYATGAINFRFRNTLDSHLLIRTQVLDNIVTVKLFGALEPGLKYTVESKIVEHLEPPIRYVQNDSLAKGTQITIRQGKTGYVVETYRTKWRDGQKQEVTLLTTDRYEPQPSIVARNSKNAVSSEAQHTSSVKPIIEDGISGPLFP